MRLLGERSVVNDNGVRFLTAVSEAVDRVDNMHTFANINTKEYLRIATLDGRYYRIRIERITKSEYDR